MSSGSLASWDEAIYASVAKGIVRTGDWIFLKMDGAAWFDKPPLAIWATAFFYKIFGVNEFSARLFSALCGVATVALTYAFGARLFGRWTGFLGALVLLTSSHYFRTARFGMLDAPLTFFLTLAFYFFWRGREGRGFWLVLSGAAIGLAFMTKSFAAFFAFPVIWIYCAWAGEMRLFRRPAYWAGIAAALALALPWYLFLWGRYGDAFLHGTVIKHLFERTSRALEGHGGGLYFYIRVLVNKYHPWVVAAVFSAPFFLYQAITRRRKEFIFVSAWMFFIFTAMTLVKTKLAWYLVPVYPALSLSVGYLLAKVLRENRAGAVRLLFVGVVGLHVAFSHPFRQDYSADLKGIAPLVASTVPPEGRVYLYDYHEGPAATFYLERFGLYVDDRDAFVQAARSGEKPFFCLIHEKDLEPLRDSLPALGLTDRGSFADLHLLTSFLLDAAGKMAYNENEVGYAEKTRAGQESPPKKTKKNL